MNENKDFSYKDVVAPLLPTLSWILFHNNIKFNSYGKLSVKRNDNYR
jgi:hypothetical protein